MKKLKKVCAIIANAIELFMKVCMVASFSKTVYDSVKEAVNKTPDAVEDTPQVSDKRYPVSLSRLHRSCGLLLEACGTDPHVHVVVCGDLIRIDGSFVKVSGFKWSELQSYGWEEEPSFSGIFFDMNKERLRLEKLLKEGK